MTQPQLEAKLMAVTEKLEEKKLQKKHNGKAVLRAIHTKVKTMEEGDERKAEEQKLQILLGTLQKYDQMFNGFNHDDNIFLRVSQVFKAEYDSRVTFPHEVAELEAEYEDIEEALDEVIDSASRAKKERTKNRVKHKRESVQNKKKEERKRLKRDFAASNQQLLKWQQPMYNKKKKPSAGAGSSSDAL